MCQFQISKEIGLGVRRPLGRRFDVLWVDSASMAYAIYAISFGLVSQYILEVYFLYIYIFGQLWMLS